MSRTLFALTLGLASTAAGALSEGVRLGEGSIDVCRAFTPDADYIETTVIRQLEGGEVELRVPRQYFEDVWDLSGGSSDTAQLFTVEIGTWEPVTRRETGERNRQGVHDWITFLVGDVVSLERQALLAANLFAPVDHPLAMYPARRGPEGLSWLATPFASDGADPRMDVFLDAQAPARLETVIACTSPDHPTFINSRCTQHFRASDLDVELSYRRADLPRWREFQAQVAAFLTCATSEAS